MPGTVPTADTAVAPVRCPSNLIVPQRPHTHRTRTQSRHKISERHLALLAGLKVLECHARGGLGQLLAKDDGRPRADLARVGKQLADIARGLVTVPDMEPLPAKIRDD